MRSPGRTVNGSFFVVVVVVVRIKRTCVIKILCTAGIRCSKRWDFLEIYLLFSSEQPPDICKFPYWIQQPAGAHSKNQPNTEIVNRSIANMSAYFGPTCIRYDGFWFLFIFTYSVKRIIDCTLRTGKHC